MVFKLKAIGEPEITEIGRVKGHPTPGLRTMNKDHVAKFLHYRPHVISIKERNSSNIISI